jgi:hypothetical protein
MTHDAMPESVYMYVWSESSFFSKSGDQIMTLEAYSELHAYNI